MPTKTIARTEISEKLLRAKEEATRHLLRTTTLPPRFTAFAASSHPNHNVVGIGIGYKMMHGKLTAQCCIRIYVDRKIAKTAMLKDCVLPSLRSCLVFCKKIAFVMTLTQCDNHFFQEIC